MAMASAPSRALTLVEQVEQSGAVQLLDARASALLEVLPDAAAATRFRRIVIQALAKNPELLACTPESVVLSVFEAATQGLEPTGAAGGAHLVPFNVKVSKNPERWEKRAQLIPDYRGVIHLVTKPSEVKGQIVPSNVVAIEARVVKEGDEFSYAEGSEGQVHHVPALAPDRSTKATTHVYVIARLRSGERIATVMDRAEVERIRNKKKGEAFSPWATDWDEMARKTVVKRAAKTLPVPPEVRSILVREDEREEPAPQGAETPAVAVPTKVANLAARLAPATEPAADAEAAADEVEGDGEWLAGDVDEAAAAPETPPESDLSLVDLLRAAEASLELDGSASSAQREAIRATFEGMPPATVQAGLVAVWPDVEIADGKVRFTANQAAAILMVAGTTKPDTFRAAWAEIAS